MELWIRSQDKTALIKTEDIRLYYMKANYETTEIWLKDRDVPVAVYESKKRALEVLDEIQSKIKNQYIVELNAITSSKDMQLVDNVLNARYNGEFIIQPQTTKLHPVNSSVIIYEMPKE